MALFNSCAILLSLSAGLLLGIGEAERVDFDGDFWQREMRSIGA